MPKHMLSARQVQVSRVGDTHDGEGLILRVQGVVPDRLVERRGQLAGTMSGMAESCSWL